MIMGEFFFFFWCFVSSGLCLITDPVAWLAELHPLHRLGSSALFNCFLEKIKNIQAAFCPLDKCPLSLSCQKQTESLRMSNYTFHTVMKEAISRLQCSSTTFRFALLQTVSHLLWRAHLGRKVGCGYCRWKQWHFSINCITRSCRFISRPHITFFFFFLSKIPDERYWLSPGTLW